MFQQTGSKLAAPALTAAVLLFAAGPGMAQGHRDRGHPNTGGAAVVQPHAAAPVHSASNWRSNAGPTWRGNTAWNDGRRHDGRRDRFGFGYWPYGGYGYYPGYSSSYYYPQYYPSYDYPAYVPDYS